MTNKPVLHLNVTKKWFDMIESGVKREEYREIKHYYHRIFGGGGIKIKGKKYHPTDVQICFSNGYSKNRRQCYKDIICVKIGLGFTLWGAEKRKQYYVIVLSRSKQQNIRCASCLGLLNENDLKNFKESDLKLVCCSCKTYFEQNKK